MNRSLTIDTRHGHLFGQLELPDTPCGLVLLARAHHAPDDIAIAAQLVEQNFAVLIMELLTSQEAQFVDATQNVPRLTQRLLDMLDLIRRDGDMENLPLLILANGDTSPAAIRASAQRDTQVKALALHGGLIDRAGREALNLLTAPSLFVYSPEDEAGQIAYQRAETYLNCLHQQHRLAPAEDPLRPIIGWFLTFFPGRPQQVNA